MLVSLKIKTISISRNSAEREVLENVLFNRRNKPVCLISIWLQRYCTILVPSNIPGREIFFGEARFLQTLSASGHSALRVTRYKATFSLFPTGICWNHQNLNGLTTRATERLLRALSLNKRRKCKNQEVISGGAAPAGQLEDLRPSSRPARRVREHWNRSNSTDAHGADEKGVRINAIRIRGSNP